MKDKGLLVSTDCMLEAAWLFTASTQAAGYNYVNIDDCYSEKNRSATGDIVASEHLPLLLLSYLLTVVQARKSSRAACSLSRPKFISLDCAPKFVLICLSLTLRSKTGIYGDSGWFTCGGYPGSYSRELQDIKTFHSWGFDYLK